MSGGHFRFWHFSEERAIEADRRYAAGSGLWWAKRGRSRIYEFTAWILRSAMRVRPSVGGRLGRIEYEQSGSHIMPT
jgi:hypothetical protein